ncbi:hypothetical protein ACNVED_16025 (plasmid) [Legionella sp. D16C41]|uniref:hypothetical protein n=1 Tax=Legionella sp. D16C41 TaxID=3402688 RepID=UPI003AF7C8C1
MPKEKFRRMEKTYVPKPQDNNPLKLFSKSGPSQYKSNKILREELKKVGIENPNENQQKEPKAKEESNDTSPSTPPQI